MKFRTEIQLKPASLRIEHKDPILAMGSCFAENIARKLEERFFNVRINPFGTLYNPLSVAEALKIVENKRLFTDNDLFFYQGQWHSFWHHHQFSGLHKEETLKTINEHIQAAHSFLKQARWLIITLGTAFVYYHLPEKRPVANCHKLPEKQFERKRLEVSDVVHILGDRLQEIRRFNDKLHIMLTVSPVRYLRDGAVQNQVSKATLILAVQELCANNPDVIYFPAYEILMDDLRDYRFYEANLTHPNDQAIHYIWEKFSAMFFDAHTLRAADDFFRLSTALRHRVMKPEAPESVAFLANLLKRITSLQKQYPYVDLSVERNKIAHLLETLTTK